jgi:hypothetical protein
MATIKVRGDLNDIKIKSITQENPKVVKKVILPEGRFHNHETKDTNYFTIITIPGCDIEVKIVGTEKDLNDNVFYKNYKINNLPFSCEENPLTTTCFESDINDIYKIEIISQEKMPGNMINPGKTIQKIYNLDYKFNFEEPDTTSETEISISKSNFETNVTINQNSDDEEGEELEEDEENNEENEDDESDTD